MLETDRWRGYDTYKAVSMAVSMVIPFHSRGRKTRWTETISETDGRSSPYPILSHTLRQTGGNHFAQNLLSRLCLPSKFCAVVLDYRCICFVSKLS